MTVKMTEAEAYAASTPEERAWVDKYNMLKQISMMDETTLLEYGQAISYVVARNERLGLVKKEGT